MDLRDGDDRQAEGEGWGGLVPAALSAAVQISQAGQARKTVAAVEDALCEEYASLQLSTHVEYTCGNRISRCSGRGSKAG